MNATFKSFLGGALFGAVVVFAIGAGPRQPPAVQPEYKLVQGTVAGQELTLATAINRELPAGWELVSVHHSFEQYGFAMMRKGNDSRRPRVAAAGSML
jgi:hypothetical protein